MYRFGEFTLDPRRRELRMPSGGVHLEPLAFDLLVYLVEHRDRVVSKIELLDGVWGHSFTSESNLTTRVKQIRRAVGDDGRSQHTVRNVPGRGYQFVAEVRAVDEGERTGLRQAHLPGALAALVERSTLVGREHELDELRSAWTEVVATRDLRVRVVTGEAGMGKSRLVAELARAVAAEGDRVLLGACHEEPGTPYEPLARVLAADTAETADEELRLRSAVDVQALGALLPELLDRLGLAADEHATGEAERQRLFQAVAGYLRRATRQSPALLVIEDLHWASPESRDLVAHLAATEQLALLMVVTSRDAAPDLTVDLSVTLSNLQRLPGTRRIALAGLSAHEVAAIVRDEHVGDQHDITELARSLHEATNGSPLFVHELLRCVAPGATQLEMVRLTPSLRDVVTARFSQLPPEHGPLLDAAAVVGTSFDAAVIGAVVQLPIEHVLDGLDRAEQLGLVVGLREPTGRFSFSHAVLREVRYAQLSAAHRMRLHQRAGGALEAAHPDTAIVDMARHFALAGPGETKRAVRYARMAGDMARAQFAHREAARWFEQAEELAAGSSDGTELCDLRTARGEALHCAGDPAHRQVLLEAAALARELGDTARLAAVALAFNEQGMPINGDFYTEVLSLVQEVLEVTPGEISSTRARLLAMYAAAVTSADYERGVEPARGAVRVARQVGDRRTLAEVLTTAHWACFAPDNQAERLAMADEIEQLARHLGDPALELQACLCRGDDVLEAGDIAAFERSTRRAYELALQTSSGDPLAHAIHGLACVAALRGDLDEAERLASEVLALTDPTAVSVFGTVAFAVMFERGRWEFATDFIAATAESSPGIPAVECAVAAYRARLGQPREARAIVRTFLDSDLARLPRSVQWLVGMVLLADAAARLGDLDAAAVFRAELEPHSGRAAWYPNAPLWPVDVALGDLASVMGDHDAAVRYAAAAVALCDDALPIQRARCQLHLAWVVRRARRRGAAAQADELVRDALSAARRVGAHGIEREAEILGLGA